MQARYICLQLCQKPDILFVVFALAGFRACQSLLGHIEAILAIFDPKEQVSCLSPQVAIITGSGQGLGAAAARLFAEHGAQLVVTDLDGAKADQVPIFTSF